MLGSFGAAVGQVATATNPTHHALCASQAFWPISVQQVHGSLGRIGGHGCRGRLGGMVGCNLMGALLVMVDGQLVQ